MRDRSNPLLDGPIPGQSLTTEPGNRPWENPPKYSTVEETAEFYVKRLADPAMTNRLMDIIEETQIPISVLSDVITMGGVMQGLHSSDMSILVAPIIIAFIKGTAEHMGIEYKLGNEKENVVNPELLRSVINELQDEEPVIAMSVSDAFGMNDIPADEVTKEEKPTKGLMERPSEAEAA